MPDTFAQSDRNKFWFTPSLGIGVHKFRNRPHAPESLPHAHEEYELHLCLRGRTEFFFSGERYALGPGDLLVINPGELHYGRHTKDQAFSDYEAVAIVLDQSIVQNVFARMVQSKPLKRQQVVFGQKVHEFKILRLIAELLLELQETAEGFEIVVESEVSQILVHLLRHHLEPKPARRQHAVYPQLPYLFMFRTLEFMRRCPENSFSLEQLCKGIGCSQSYFTQRFRNSTGLSPHVFYTRLLIKEAMRLLRSCDDPVKTVAYELGFKDVSHFCRVFQSLAGTTPRTFRYLEDSEYSVIRSQL